VTVACAAGVVGTCSQQVGEQRSTGAEFELNTHLSESWQTLFGYAYTDARVVKSGADPAATLVGTQLTNSSRNNAHVWTRYDVHSGPLRFFGVGAGAFYLSSHAGTAPNGNDQRLLLLPGYAVVDLAVYYSLFGKYDLTMKVGNVFDKLYYEGVNAGTDALGVVPGSPRYMQLSVHAPLY
jgi:iron complex outermembrane receptor protein